VQPNDGKTPGEGLDGCPIYALAVSIAQHGASRDLISRGGSVGGTVKRSHDPKSQPDGRGVF